jgi:hypothetical protein
LSAFQYSFDLSVKIDVKNETNKKSTGNKFFKLIFGTEIWSLLLVFIIHDLPFSIIRLLVLVHYEHKLSKNYTLYFFVIKNLVLSTCELYYISLLILKHLEEHKKNKKQRNDEEDCSKK